MKYYGIMSVLILSITCLSSESFAQENLQVKPQEKKILVALDNHYKLVSGHKLSPKQFIYLDKGRKLDLHLPDDRTVEIEGPASGKVEDLIKGRSSRMEWLSDLKATVFRQTNDRHVMVTRGNKAVELWRPNSIPVPFSGVFCVEKKSELVFYRPGLSEHSLTIKVKHGVLSKEIYFPAGVDIEVEWPSDLNEIGEFELSHRAWSVGHRPTRYKFKIIRLETMSVRSLAKAGCTYHLKNIKRFTHF